MWCSKRLALFKTIKNTTLVPIERTNDHKVTLPQKKLYQLEYYLKCVNFSGYEKKKFV